MRMQGSPKQACCCLQSRWQTSVLLPGGPLDPNSRGGGSHWMLMSPEWSQEGPRPASVQVGACAEVSAKATVAVGACMLM